MKRTGVNPPPMHYSVLGSFEVEEEQPTTDRQVCDTAAGVQATNENRVASVIHKARADAEWVHVDQGHPPPCIGG